MSNPIRHNAYRILGFDNNASQRDVVRRHREIINRIKIDDHPKYALDLNLPDSFRTGDSVEDALKKLQNRRNNLTEYFFWFSISDTVDEDAFEHLQYGDAASYGHAIQIWKDNSLTENSAGLSYKRNLAILYCLYMFSEEDDAALTESVLIWRDLINSDRFWTLFQKRYELINDQKIHEGVIADLRKNITANISDVYYDLYEYYNNTKYIKKFHDTFDTFGQKTEKYLLKPTHQSIYETIENLTKIEKGDYSSLEKTDGVHVKCDNCGKVSNRPQKPDSAYMDGSILCRECHTAVGKEWKRKVHSRETVKGSSKKLRYVEKTMERLETNLKRLNDMGLYDADKSMVVRDHAAEAVRNISVAMHNQTHMREKSLELLDLAKRISATAGTRERLESDSKTITANMARDEENAFVLKMGRIRKKKLVVKETFIEYGKSKIYYDDVNYVVYYRSGGSDCLFEVTADWDQITVKLGNVAYWTELINRVVPLVLPRLTDKLVKKIFDEDITIVIGNIRFDKTGYHRSRRLRKDESILWSDQIYIPKFNYNGVVLFKTKNNAPNPFAHVSLDEPNSVVIPALVEKCFHEFRSHIQN